MSELRQDRTTGAWVIVAPERGRRPRQRSAAAPAPDRAPEPEPPCPFCPGNEHLLPGIVEEVSAADPPGWCVRVVPNKYPALRPELAPQPLHAPFHTALEGYGVHEVVIESPRHRADLDSLSDPEISAVVGAYHRRSLMLMRKPGIEAVLLFRNNGRSAGASLRHPHAQLVALPLVPPRLRAMTDWARQRHRESGRCVTCEELDIERADGRRLVEESAHFLLLVPFAATVPFEMWLAPKRHQAGFAEAEAEELADLGVLLRRALARLKAALGDPPYNFVIESPGKGEEGAADQHWRLRIAPDTVIPGGFELGAGIPINPSKPEDDAAALRAAG
jgi:UDPglucose--hexose-1-phosphate uridylyltransferase